jgi:hypothetical protein
MRINKTDRQRDCKNGCVFRARNEDCGGDDDDMTSLLNKLSRSNRFRVQLDSGCED